MGWGDEIVAAGQAQRLFDANGKRVQILDALGNPRWHPIWDGNPILVRPDEAWAGPFQTLRSGQGCRPYIVYPFSEETGWTFNKAFRCRDHIAKLYLTEAERERGRRARATYGPYVLIEPFTKHPNFCWSWDRWNALVRACPDLTFVQHTHGESDLISGVYHEAASFRDACGLVASAECYVRSESGMCHAAAALGVRQVTMFGGCMDAEVMAGYPGQTVIVDGGLESPCGSWKPCTHCAEAMDAIHVGMVVDALRERLAERQAA